MSDAIRLLDRTLTLDQVQEVVPFSRAHIRRLEISGKFPLHIQFGPGKIGWLESEIYAWRESKRQNAVAA